MRINKKIKIIILTLTLVFSYCQIIINASYTNDDQTATFDITTEENHNIYGMDYNAVYGTTTNNNNLEGNQKINILSMKTDGINSKLVSWAIQGNQTGYTRSGLSNIAKDYEKTHPGWIVLGGINADQYYPKFGNKIAEDGSFFYTNQPYYPLIMDYESRFPITPTGVSSSNYVGISNNNEVDSFVYASSLSGLKLEIIKEEEVIKTFDVDKINETPSDNQITVWFAYNSEETSGKYITHQLSTDNNLYVVENPDLAYMNNNHNYSVGSKQDSLFGKGKITLITNQITIDGYNFAVESNNEQLQALLTTDTYIKVQYRYNDEAMNQVESACGYHSIQRMNNQDVKGEGSYDTLRYNRSIFGKKADGTYVLVTIAKGQYAGTTHDESNAILKYYGVTEAYQQDGGGSVTAIIRNNAGTFDIVNESSDSSVKERSILNGLFFVVRDPGYNALGMNSTRNSITITKTTDVNDLYISNVTATINNQTYKLTDEPLIINNLEEDTTYQVELAYDVTDCKKIVHIKTIIYATTQGFNIPSANVKIKSINTTSVVLEHKTNDYIYHEITATINNQTYDLLNYQTVRINNLTKLTDYTVTINYIVEDPITKKPYSSQEQLTFTTLYNPFPEVITLQVLQLNSTTVDVSYQIYDEGKSSQLIYIYYGKNKESSYPIDIIYNNDNTIIGSVTIDITQLLDETIDFEISIMYESYGEMLFSKSDITTFKYVKTDEEQPTKKCSLKKDQSIYNYLTALSLLMIVLKKKKRP